jgi:hypothetical protein
MSQARIGRGRDFLVGGEEFSSALLYDVEGRSADEVLDVRQVTFLSQKIISLGATPQLLKFRITDEHMGCIGSVGAVFQIFHPAVP